MDNILHDFNSLIDLEKLPRSIDVVYHIAQSEFYREFPNSSEDIFNVNTLSTLKLAEWQQEKRVLKNLYLLHLVEYTEIIIKFLKKNDGY